MDTPELHPRLTFRPADQMVVFADGIEEPFAAMLPWVEDIAAGWKPDHIDLMLDDGRMIVVMPQELLELARSMPSAFLPQELRERIAAL